MSTRSVLFGIILSLVVTLGLQASPIGLGTVEPGGANCDPYGCPSFFGLGTYQQVYLGSALGSAFSSGGFSGPVGIDALIFQDSQEHNGGNPGGGNYSVTLSYTNQQPGGLDLSNPNNNIGADPTVFFSGSLPALTAGSTPGTRDLTITGNAPFYYDPSMGNLLLTVTVTNPADGTPVLFLDENMIGQSNLTTYAYFGTVNGGNDLPGLYTQFDVGPVNPTPEPGTIFLTLAGAGLIGLGWRRRRA